jgi:hypothetical protein
VVTEADLLRGGLEVRKDGTWRVHRRSRYGIREEDRGLCTRLRNNSRMTKVKAYSCASRLTTVTYSNLRVAVRR